MDEDTKAAQAEEERLLRPGRDDELPTEQHAALASSFDSNVISLACQPGRPEVYVGTGTGLRCSSCQHSLQPETEHSLQALAR